MREKESASSMDGGEADMTHLEMGASLGRDSLADEVLQRVGVVLHALRMTAHETSDFCRDC